MSPEHKRIITDNLEGLVNLDADTVALKLLSAQIITIHERDEIMAKKTPRDRAVSLLLDKLVRKQDKGFSVLIEALKEGNPELAAILESAGMLDLLATWLYNLLSISMNYS